MSFAAPEDAITKEDILATLRHMQALAREQGTELDAAKENLIGLGKRLDGALSDLGGAAEETRKVQASLDAEREARAEAEAQRDKEMARADSEKKRADVERAHVSRIKNYLSIILAAFLVLLVQQLPWGMLMPPMSIYARVAASMAAAGIAWVIVARFV